MSSYDFTSLSAQDFEELARDLLQAEFGRRIEAFKSGRDSGIDLRFSGGIGNHTIIQCKHFAKSGFSKLLSHLKTEELPKILRLQPERYIVFTSVRLTPGNKDEIVNALRPFITSTADVIGADDVESLLSRHPAVETRNFKLWLNSTSVIERVLHNARVCQTEFEVERIRKKLPLFVQSNAFPKALELLENERIAVISGPPGIGKTTLAEMLLYSYLEKGFEPVVINAEIDEGTTFFKNDAKRVFYYDDFLGQVYLGDRAEYLGRNEDKALTDFAEMVQRSVHSRFILTTREHILSAAVRLSERLAVSPLLQNRCILQLSSYSFGNRARILYNHLYFSELPADYKQAILTDDFFLEIIKHDHFNPRLIEWLSTALRRKEVSASGYKAYVQELLVAPHRIWRGAFSNQLSDAARNVLLSFYTLGGWGEIVDIEPAFRSLHQHRAQKYNSQISPGDFRHALRELDGAFLSYGAGRAQYLNPSIREFIASLIEEDQDTAEDLIHSAIRFSQIQALEYLAGRKPESAVAIIINSSEPILLRMAQRLLRSPSVRLAKTKHGMVGTPIDLGAHSRLSFCAELADRYRSLAFCEITLQASQEMILQWDGSIPQFISVFHMLERLSE